MTQQQFTTQFEELDEPFLIEATELIGKEGMLANMALTQLDRSRITERDLYGYLLDRFEEIENQAREAKLKVEKCL